MFFTSVGGFISLWYFTPGVVFAFAPIAYTGGVHGAVLAKQKAIAYTSVFCLPYLQRCLLHVVAVVTMFQVSVPKTAMQIFVLSASVAIAEVSDEQDLVFLRSTCKFSFTEGWCFDVCRYFLKSNAIPKPLLQNAF